VCSEIDDENTIEHFRLSHCDRTQEHTQDVQRKQRFQTQKAYYSNLIKVIAQILAVVQGFLPILFIPLSVSLHLCYVLTL
jgi:hypothetical protein